MSDQTISNPQALQKPETTQELIRQLGPRIGELMELLRGQREILLKRGMNLPPGALESLQKLKTRVDNLSRAVLNTQIELRQLRGLAETAALINSSLTTEEVLNQVMDTVIQLVSAERGYIVLKNRETGELEARVARGMDQEQLDTKKELIMSRSIINRVATTGETELTDNASQDERYAGQQSIVGFALRSILAVPLKVRGEVIGVVYCDNRIVAGLFKAHEKDLLTAFANQAAVAIENAQLFEAARARLAQVTEMRDLMNNLFNSVGSGILTLDAQNRITISNTAAERILHTDALIGRTLNEVVPDTLTELFAAIESIRKEQKQIMLSLEPVFPHVGQRYWNLILTPLRDQRSMMGGVTILLDDLTEQRQREATLAEVRRYLPLALVKNIRTIDAVDVGGQEREITAFACDVRGFTTFSERLEPDELMTIINKYLSLASDAINLYEGIVDKYMGDAVTGLFNTHLNPQEDHAERAVAAALQLIFDLHAQHEVMSEEERLFYGIGVHTGMAVLGNVGSKDRKEFAALGEAVNISKYLESNAGPGEVVISGETYERVRDSFECELVTEIRRPKAGYEHIKIYRVLKRKKAGRSGALMIDPELLELLEELKED